MQLSFLTAESRSRIATLNLTVRNMGVRLTLSRELALEKLVPGLFSRRQCFPEREKPCFIFNPFIVLVLNWIMMSYNNMKFWLKIPSSHTRSYKGGRSYVLHYWFCR